MYMEMNSRGKLWAFEGTPFPIRRVFGISQVPEGLVRGGHAHIHGEQQLLCLRGEVHIHTIGIDWRKDHREVLYSHMTMYIPPLVWTTQTYFDEAELLVMCSNKYDESDYIRDWDEFVRIKTS